MRHQLKLRSKPNFKNTTNNKSLINSIAHEKSHNKFHLIATEKIHIITIQINSKHCVRLKIQT